MALIAQQTFVDRLNEAEGQLGELASFADHLANRLVGYADEKEAGYGDNTPSNGILSDVGDAAGRMSRKAREIRSYLNRISEALPAETVNAGTRIG